MIWQLDRLRADWLRQINGSSLSSEGLQRSEIIRSRLAPPAVRLCCWHAGGSSSWRPIRAELAANKSRAGGQSEASWRRSGRNDENIWWRDEAASSQRSGEDAIAAADSTPLYFLLRPPHLTPPPTPNSAVQSAGSAGREGWTERGQSKGESRAAIHPTHLQGALCSDHNLWGCAVL